jgi:hypothetical protein
MRGNSSTWGYALLQLVAVVVVVAHVREGGLVGAALALALTGALFGAWAELRGQVDRRAVDAEDESPVPAGRG